MPHVPVPHAAVGELPVALWACLGGAEEGIMRESLILPGCCISSKIPRLPLSMEKDIVT